MSIRILSSTVLLVALAGCAASQITSGPVELTETERKDDGTLALESAPERVEEELAKEVRLERIDQDGVHGAASPDPLRDVFAPPSVAESMSVGGVADVALSKSSKRAGGSAMAGSISRSESSAVMPPAPTPTPDTQRSRESYTDYGVNESTLASVDAQSTFSIDVDTASYTMARRKLREETLPNTASVRVEEFLNFIDYDYVLPTGEAPFAVDMEAAPNPFLPSHHLLRVGVQGAKVESEDRTPVHLTFLVDTSGSMQSPDKMGLVKKSLHTLVDSLGPDDTIALATYAGSVRRILSPTSAGRAAMIHGAIDDLYAGGSTAMASGIDLAYQMASESMFRGHENRVLVLSDGDANVGATSHQEILDSIRGYAEEGITLSTIGYGMGNYQDTMMEQLANQGDGNYFYVDSMDEARRVFRDDVTSTLQVIAKDVKIQVEFNPEVVYAYRLIGYENRDIADRDFRNDRVDAGEIGAGHQVTALYDVVLMDDFRSDDLAVVRIRNKAPGRDSAAIEWETHFPSNLVEWEFPASTPDFRVAVGASYFAELLRGSPHTAEVTYDEVHALLSRAARADHPEDEELMGLVRTAGRLSGERRLSTR